jgi:hypothetical protein
MGLTPNLCEINAPILNAKATPTTGAVSRFKCGQGSGAAPFGAGPKEHWPYLKLGCPRFAGFPPWLTALAKGAHAKRCEIDAPILNAKATPTHGHCVTPQEHWPCLKLGCPRFVGFPLWLTALFSLPPSPPGAPLFPQFLLNND